VNPNPDSGKKVHSISESESRFRFSELCLNHISLATWHRRRVLTIINDLRKTSVAIWLLQINRILVLKFWIIKMCKIGLKQHKQTTVSLWHHITSVLYSICRANPNIGLLYIRIRLRLIKYSLGIYSCCYCLLSDVLKFVFSCWFL